MTARGRLIIASTMLIVRPLDKLEFGGESPLTIRAWCSAFRYFPNPLGIVPVEQFDKLEFGGVPPQAIRAWCSGFRYCPNPLGIVPAEQFNKLEFI